MPQTALNGGDSSVNLGTVKPLKTGTSMPKVKYLETIPAEQPIRGKSQLVSKMEVMKKHQSNFPRYSQNDKSLDSIQLSLPQINRSLIKQEKTHQEYDTNKKGLVNAVISR